jgi:hypothetical protein
MAYRWESELGTAPRAYALELALKQEEREAALIFGI